MMMTNEAIANEPAKMTSLPLAIAFVLLTRSQSKMDSDQCELCNMNNNNNNNNTTCMFNLIICKNFKYFITY